jgi:hypothetical protein
LIKRLAEGLPALPCRHHQQRLREGLLSDGLCGRLADLLDRLAGLRGGPSDG